METSKDVNDRNQRIIRRAKEVRERAAEQLRRVRAKQKRAARVKRGDAAEMGTYEADLRREMRDAVPSEATDAER